MKKINIFLLIICLSALISCKEKTIEIFVSIDGKIENNGTKKAPLLKIHDAINIAEQIKLDNREAKISINILPGDYYLSSPIIIKPILSDLSFKGSKASEVTIKGSVPLNLSWEKYDNNIYIARLSDNHQFDQLIANSKPMTLARYPNYNENGGHWQGHAADVISKERIKSWKKPVGAILHAMHDYEWGGFHYTITEINSNGTAELEGGHQNNRPALPHPKYRMVENVFEELNSPGEWYIDKENRMLYYWPDDNINIETALFEGVILKNLVEIKGDEYSPVRNVSFKGIKFEHTQRTFMEPYEPLLRSDWTIYRGGAVFIEGAENCIIHNCEFTNLGGNAIFISGYNRGVEISENHIHECNASGISFVGKPGSVRSPSFQYSHFIPINELDTIRGPQNNQYPKDCIAKNNLIYRTGRIEKQTAGVQISMSMDITVSNNSIYDVPRAGINIGDGTWGGHIIEYNDVFNTVLESGDHGSFNSWGRDRFWHPNRHILDSITQRNPEMPLWDAIHTTIIRNNRFRCDHGWDIDLDDGSSNYHIYNNLCLNGGIKLREGFYRKVENNIIINNGFHPHVWFVNSEDIFRKNIVSTNHKDIRLKAWGKEVDYNLFPDREELEEARKNGIDSNSIFGDPLFEDAVNNNFRVKNNSPAHKIGFVNFSMNSFGVQNPELKKIAKTPEIPELIFIGIKNQSGNSTTKWLGAKIKNQAKQRITIKTK
ncbi:right-handed parallel beta-helix repeat-containing protein [Bacteroidota bacterium]